MPAAQIVVVGDAAVDLVLEVDRIDGLDEKITVQTSQRRLGGTGANAAAVMVALGSHAELIAAVGDDPFGAWLRGSLASCGVGQAGVVTRSGATTLAVILLGANGRLVVVDRGVADELEPGYIASHLGHADVVYLSSQPAALAAVVVDSHPGMIVIGLEARQLAQGLHDWLPVLEGADVVLTNRAGGHALRARGVLSSDRASGRVPIVVTLGAEGCVVYQPGRPGAEIPALRVEAKDATGAGDCFAGALCHFLGRGADLMTAARLATAAASLSTTAVGAQGYLPDEPSVRQAARGLLERVHQPIWR